MRRSPFFAPAPLGAVAVLAINDHWLKDRFHNAVTGKLTDLALCFFFPLLLSVLLRPLVRADRARLAVSGALTAALFTALELWPPAGAALTAAVALVGRPLGFGLTPFTRDLTDLLALAMVPLAFWYGLRRLQGPPLPARPPWLPRVAAMGATLVLLVAESPLPDCEHRASALTFRVSGECGAAGVIVVDSDNVNGTVTAFNGDVVLGASKGRYQGGACPYRIDEGGWYVEQIGCPRQDGGATDGGELDAGARDAGASDASDAGPAKPGAELPACIVRRCTSQQENGALWISCTEGSMPVCKARLTLVEGP